MKSFITKLALFLFCITALLVFGTTKAEAANPTVSGRVIMDGTNTPISGVWVRWKDSNGGTWYTKTDSSGRYSFEDLSGMKPKDIGDMLDNSIDTNGDGAKEAKELVFPNSDEQNGQGNGNGNKNFDLSSNFNSLANTHSFTAIVPAAWSGTFNTVSGVALNSAASSYSVADIIFTPDDVQITQGPSNIYTISGVVFDDFDKDGIKNATDSALPGITITLSGSANASTTTASDGRFSFKNLATGTYTVTVTVPTGYGTTTASSTTVAVNSDNTLNFGLDSSGGSSAPTCSASIKGQAFNDLDGDGKLDATEPALTGLTITLSSPDLPGPFTMQTLSNGTYSFASLCASTYTITTSVNAPFRPTTAMSRTINATNGQTYNANNFGARAYYSIGGNVFDDLNTSQVKDASESGWVNATIFLSGTAFGSARTDANGNYTFSDMPAGSYQISLRMPPGYGSTTPNSLNIDLRNNFTLNFGINPIDTLKVGGACNNTAADIAVVIDHSGSMDDDDPASGLTKIDEARKAANQFIDVIARNAPTARIGIVQFSESRNYPNDPDTSGVLAGLSSDFTSLKSTVNGIRATGGTCFQCGVDLAVKMLDAGTRPNSQKMIVIMTDGLANQTITSNGSNINTADAENEAIYTIQESVNSQNIIYHTIGVGSGANNIDETFLTQVAATNGGRYYNDPTNGNMEQIYVDIASKIVASGVITGLLYNDENLNKTLDPGEVGVPNLTVELESPVLVKKQTVLSDGNGRYSFYGLCDGTYSITEIASTPWVLTTSGTYSGVNVKSGSTFPNYDFGNRYGYTITGAVFNDINKNRKQDTGDRPYTGGITISASSGTLTTDSTTGTFRVEGLWPGTYTVSYTSPLPAGYILIYPKNGPPPTFLVTVGDTCSVDTGSGAYCDKGDVKSLDFSISNSIPWIQTNDLNVRLDNGFTNKVPDTSLYSTFALGQTSNANSPGVLIIGNGSYDFGAGKASSTNWIAGGGLYPEVYKNTSKTISRVSYTNLLAKAQQAKLDITDMTTIPTCRTLTNCNLNPGLASGIYLANGDVELDDITFLVGRKYIFLINGNLKIKGNIEVPPSGNATFAVKHTITVDQSVGIDPVAPLPAGQIQGNFTTEDSFLIPGQDDCVIGPDKMLNLEGAIIVNANGTGGKFSYSRDLCGGNPEYPTVTIRPRLDFIFSSPTFLMQHQLYSNEVTP